MNDAPLTNNTRGRWLNRTVLGIRLASLFSDWSHEIATAVMPAFLATMGMAAAAARGESPCAARTVC